MSKDLFEQIREKEFYEVFGLNYNDGCYLETLLQTSAISPHIEWEIERRLYAGVLTQDEGEKIIEFLQQNQRDPIRDGFNYQQGDIKRKLRHGIDRSTKEPK